MHHQIAWHFEQRVGDEENTCAEGECSVAHARRRLIGLLRKTDVRPIEVRQHVHQDQKRHDPPLGAPDCALHQNLFIAVHGVQVRLHLVSLLFP
jgi:hypothetical protein